MRIIPAYAGSTPRSPCGPPASTDHPRIRGEHNLPTAGDDKAAGSSPHTRGALSLPEAADRRPRIIPAYAGSTRDQDTPALTAADHPRIRGEHNAGRSSGAHLHGSSPHTRGAPTGRHLQRADRRIIPAYAGSTFGRPISRMRNGGSSPHTRGALARRRPAGRSGLDHPRIRGEHRNYIRRVGGLTGSSPHTRGAPASGFPPAGRRRIIPAYAGSTQAVQDTGKPGTDHPRIRGEHVHGGAGPAGVDGSSPHTRGARVRHRRHLRRGGIIPAYAGSTFILSLIDGFLADHPRIRGEHSQADLPPLYGVGSSPHTRGALGAVADALRESRIIPAYAGSTFHPRV